MYEIFVGNPKSDYNNGKLIEGIKSINYKLLFSNWNDYVNSIYLLISSTTCNICINYTKSGDTEFCECYENIALEDLSMLMKRTICTRYFIDEKEDESCDMCDFCDMNILQHIEETNN